MEPIEILNFSAENDDIKENAKRILNRWIGLQHAIYATKSGTLFKQLLAREQYLFGCMLDNLKTFTHRMLIYFSNSKIKRPGHLTLMYAQNLVLNQVSFDLNVIHQAIAQRLTFGELLAKADHMAETFLEPAVTANLFQDKANALPSAKEPHEPKPIILTYLNKAPTIRMMPYSPIALVSLPMPAAAIIDKDIKVQQGAARDFLALAHEIGHLVFWKGYAQKSNAKFASFLNRKLRHEGASHYIADGVEETVADMYGALVVGLPIFYTSQSKAITRQRERYFAANPHYMVIPELRPSIYVATLSAQGDYTKLAIADAEKEWHRALIDYYGDANLTGDVFPPRTVEVEAGQYRISYNTAVTEITAAVDTGIYQPYLRAVQSRRPGKLGLDIPTLPGSLDNDKPVTVDTVLDEAADNILSGQFPPESTLSIVRAPQETPDLSAYVDGKPWRKSQKTDYWDIWFNRLLTEERAQVAALQDAHLDVAYDDLETPWYTTLYAGGWVMEGPGNSKGTGGGG